MRVGAVAAAVGGGLILTGTLGIGEATVDGQVVFVPTAGPMLGEISDASPLQIRACDPSAEGLSVSGTVTAVGPVVTIIVSADDPTTAGVRVGRGFAAQAGLMDDSAVGDFTVTLPWADKSALFALAQEADPPESLVSGLQVVRCPDLAQPNEAAPDVS